jgi:hypothetical protein
MQLAGGPRILCKLRNGKMYGYPYQDAEEEREACYTQPAWRGLMMCSRISFSVSCACTGQVAAVVQAAAHKFVGPCAMCTTHTYIQNPVTYVWHSQVWHPVEISGGTCCMPNIIC